MGGRWADSGGGVPADGGVGGAQVRGAAVRRAGGEPVASVGNRVTNQGADAPARLACDKTDGLIMTQPIAPRNRIPAVGVRGPSRRLCSPARAADAPADGVEFFEKKIRPVLVEHCYDCHSAKAKKVRGGLRLDSRAQAARRRRPRPRRRARRPGQEPAHRGGRLQEPDLQMPKDGKLPDAVIADLTAWVKMGAPWGKEDATVAAARQARLRPAATQARPLGLAADRPAGTADRQGRRLAARPGGSLHPRQAGGEKSLAGAARRQAHPAAPRHVRPDRPAADAGGDRRVPQGRIAGRLREGGRSAAGVAAVRRALGRGTGSIWCATARRAATSSITRSPTPTSTAITSSAPSTPTCPTTSSSRSTSPAICWRSRASTRPTVSTSRFSAPASGSSARRSIRRWTSARTRPTASTTASTCSARRSSA